MAGQPDPVGVALADELLAATHRTNELLAELVRQGQRVPAPAPKKAAPAGAKAVREPAASKAAGSGAAPRKS